MSANEAAALLGIKPNVYYDAERGKNAEFIWEFVKNDSSDLFYFSLTPAEACALARRRSGAEISDLCAAVGGISKPTFLRREREAHPSIIDMWRARGYTF